MENPKFRIVYGEKMQKPKSLTANFIMNIILTMSSVIFPLITFPYVSRILLPDGIGKISFVTSVVSYFVMFAQLGIPIYGIRSCAKVRDCKEKLSRTVHELFFINLVMSVISYVILFIAVICIPRLCQEKLLFVIVSLTIGFNTIGMEWLYKALEQYTYITVRSVIFKFIAFILMFLLVHDQKDYIHYGLVTIFAASASNIFNFINIHNYISMKSLTPYNLKQHLKPIAVFFAMSCATTIYTNLDTVMLGFMKSDIDVGYYNAAVKVKTILISVVTSLGTVLLPRVSYYIETGLWDEFRRIAEKAIEFVLVIAVPACIYFMMFAEECIYFLSGDAFRGSILPMQIIMPTLVLIGLTNIMGIQMLVPMGKENCVLYSELAGAVVNLILNTVLINLFSASGAAVATLVAEAVVWVVQFYCLKTDVLRIYAQMQYGVLIRTVILAALVSFWIKWMKWNLFMILTVSASMYFGVYTFLLFLAKEPLIMQMEDKILGNWRR